VSGNFVHEQLRDQQDRLAALALQLDQRLHQLIALFQSAPAACACRHVEHAGRALEEQHRRATWRERCAQLIRGRAVLARKDGVQPTPAHRVQDPQTEVAREADAR